MHNSLNTELLLREALTWAVMTVVWWGGGGVEVGMVCEESDGRGSCLETLLNFNSRV